jgi:hypothetical protein
MERPTADRRRLAVVLAAALALAAAALLPAALRRRDAAPPEPPGARANSPAPAAPPRFVSPPAPAPPRAEHVARYDGRSGRLPRAEAPGERYAPTRARSPAAGPTLVAWPERDRALAGAPVRIFARVPDEETAVDGVSVALRAPGGGGVEISMRPAAAPGTFVAQIATPPLAPDARGAFPPPREIDALVVARGRQGGVPFERAVVVTILAQRSGAEVAAGSPRVERRGGDLELRFDAEVERPGDYFAYAELWGEAGPIAFARRRLPGLAPGRAPVVLTFGGAILRESGVSGPYRVRSLELLAVDTIPPHRSRPIEEVATTPAWPSSEFY